MKRVLPLVLLASFCHVAPAQQVRYVTDSLRLEARTGPSTENRIVSMLPSGTELRVLEEAEGWSRIELPDGGEGWILTRFLMSDPPARSELERAVAELGAIRDRSGGLQDELGNLRVMNEALGRERDELERESKSLSAELAELKRTASAAIAMRDENRTLKERLQAVQASYDQSERNYLTLSESRQRDWFVAGAAVLLCGIALGLIAPRIRWKRKRGWGEL